MKVSYFLLALILGIIRTNAQVGISRSPNFQPDNRSFLHVKADDNAARMPRSNTAAVLPVSAAGTTDNGTQGSIIFNRETGSIVQNDGTTWKISDPIVTTMKNNKMARFIRNGTVTTNCAPCNVFPPNCIVGADQQCTVVNVPLTAATPALNEIPNDVELLTAAPGNVINFKTNGLYRLSFKSGVINIGRPVCVGLSTGLYSRLNLEISSDNGTTWKPINNTVSNTTGGLLSSLPLGSIDVGESLAFTYMGLFNANDKVRLRFYGNQTILVGGCIGSNMFFSMNSTGNSISDIIVEKLNMQ